MANTINGINDDVISQGVLDGFVAAILPLQAFTTSFSSDAVKRGDKVSVPRIGAQSAAVAKVAGADYVIQDNTSDAVEISLGQPVYVSGGLDDVEIASSSVLNLEMYGKQKGFQLGKKVVQDIMANITLANYGAAAFTGAAGTFDVDSVVTLAQVCDTADMPEDMRSLVLKETYYANLLKDQTVTVFNAYGSTDPLRENKIPRLAGFDLYKSTLIPGNAQNLVGFAVHPSALALAIRYLAPQDGNGYIRAEAITDAATGITIGVREWYDQDSGTKKKVWECVYGAAVGVAAGIKRIVSA